MASPPARCSWWPGSSSSAAESQQIADYGGLRRVTPVLAGTFLVAGLASLSLPGLATFVSEIMVLLGAFGGPPPRLAIVAVPRRRARRASTCC